MSMVVLAHSACLLVICYITYRHKFGTTGFAFTENVPRGERENKDPYNSVSLLWSDSLETHLVAFRQ